MTVNSTRLSRQVLAGLGGVLITIILAGGLAFLMLPQLSSHASPTSPQQAAGTTCAQAPTKVNCDNQDPERQGCAADAETFGRADISENGIIIGRVERRWSHQCQSWWGRVFDYRVGSQANMYITVAGSTLSASATFVSDQYRILYSSMVFVGTSTRQIPAITGSLDIDGRAQSPGATIPAINVPNVR